MPEMCFTGCTAIIMHLYQQILMIYQIIRLFKLTFKN